MLNLATKFAHFLPVVVAQNLGEQTLGRTPEPTSEMEGEANVAQYNRALETQLALSYALALRTIFRVRQDWQSQSALDIACGPGHFTLALKELFPLSRVVGLDISENMISAAHANAALKQADCVDFRAGDALQLAEYEADEFSLSTFNQAAHHLSDPEDDSDPRLVAQVLSELDRVTDPRGVVLSTDLVRMKSEFVTRRYVGLMSQDYEQRGLGEFRDDFRNSMYAAWTAEELAGSVPRSGKRRWWQIVPRLLPTIQVIVGLPLEQPQPWVRSGNPWKSDADYIPRALRTDWTLLTSTIALGSIKPL